MPTYVYEVVTEDSQSGERFEVVQKMADPPLTHHPETGQPVRRVFLPRRISAQCLPNAGERAMKDDSTLTIHSVLGGQRPGSSTPPSVGLQAMACKTSPDQAMINPAAPSLCCPRCRVRFSLPDQPPGKPACPKCGEVTFPDADATTRAYLAAATAAIGAPISQGSDATRTPGVSPHANNFFLGGRNEIEECHAVVDTGKTAFCQPLPPSGLIPYALVGSDDARFPNGLPGFGTRCVPVPVPQEGVSALPLGVRPVGCVLPFGVAGIIRIAGIKKSLHASSLMSCDTGFPVDDLDVRSVAASGPEPGSSLGNQFQDLADLAQRAFACCQVVFEFFQPTHRRPVVEPLATRLTDENLHRYQHDVITDGDAFLNRGHGDVVAVTQCALHLFRSL